MVLHNGTSTYRLWVDNSGNLRISTSDPATEQWYCCWYSNIKSYINFLYIIYLTMVQEYKVKREDLDKILNKLGELPYKYGKVINDIVQEINNLVC